MANVYEDTVADFDLNFLQPSTHNVNIARIEKQRQSIINVKNKIIASHCLLQKFYLQKDKLEETESLLLASKEECKQACLDYKVTLEKCIQMEKDVIKLKDVNRELEQKMIHLDNQCEAMKSHAHQLQLLIKEHESVIEVLNIEKQLDKNTVKDYEKKLASLEKEREQYLRDIQFMRDVILGKKKSKICKDIINKYKHLKGLEENLESDNSGDESFLHDSPLGSPIHDQQHKDEAVTFSDKIIKGVIYESGRNNKIKDAPINDNDYDCCTEEVVSEDTGRGSSLAFSDADKFLNSPDLGYGTEGHHNVVNKDVIHVDVGTSPIRIEENILSSPNIFDDEALLSENIDKNRTKSPEYFITDIPLSTEIVTIKEKRQLVDAGTDPIHHFTHMVHTSTSPIAFEVVNVSMNCTKSDAMNLQVKRTEMSTDLPKKDCSVVCHKNINTLSSGKEIEISTGSLKKKCLEQNNSKKICDESIYDCEVEMILNKMRFEHVLITPIPKTPAMSHSQQKESNVLCHQSETHDHVGCPDAQKIREENKALHANISYLCKEIMQIKDILKTKIPENVTEQNMPDSIQNVLTCQLFDDSSQDTVTLPKDVLLSDNCRNDSMLVCHTSENNLDLRSASSKLDEQDLISKDNFEYVKQQPKHLKHKTNLDCDETSCHNDIEVIETILLNSEEEDSQDFLTDIIDNNLYGNNQVRNAVNDSCTNTKIQFQDDVDSIEKIPCSLDHEKNVVGVISTNQYQNSTTINKVRKPSKLDRFKKKILPKSKISGTNSPTLRKLRKRTQLVPITNKEKIKKSLEILNNKEAYNKALKVMTEIKSKNNGEIKKDFHKPNSKLSKQPEDKASENIENNKNCESQESENNLKQINAVKDTHKLQDKIRVSSGDDTISDNSLDNKKDISKPCSNTKDIVVNKTNEVQTIATRSRSRILANMAANTSKNHDIKNENNNQPELKPQKTNRRRKRVDSNNSDISCKRMLRSSNSEKTGPRELSHDLNSTIPQSEQVAIDYTDLDVFSTNTEIIVEKENIQSDISNVNLRESMDERNNLDKNPNISLSKLNKRRSNSLLSNNSEITSKRLLRSSNSESVKDEHAKVNKLQKSSNKQNLNVDEPENTSAYNTSINDSITSDKHIQQSNEASSITTLSNSILCKMIVKHGTPEFKSLSTNVTDKITNKICTKIESSIADILEAQPDTIQSAITQLVEEMKQMNEKSLLAGLMKHLEDPARKLELYKIVTCHGSLVMTKREQIILTALQRLNTPESNIINKLLSNIEFTLFRLNKSPEFDTIESLSHFYAVTCKLFHMKYRLKTFLLDAMYCLQYKAVALIKQCLTTWTHILPMAHMKYAKTPLITCIVYLLHFYKCEDKFNRVQDIRWLLNKKYFYKFSDWNETKILEMFKNAIKSVKDDPSDRHMLRIALLIFAKRHGPKWCQKNVINNMLLPMIEAENTAERIKIFCIKMLGPLFKPYPADMKVHCEIIVNQLLDMLDQEDLSHGVKEAIFTSLIYMSKHSPPRVTKALLSWQPEEISAELENLLKAYVREKPIKAWITILSRIHM